MEVFYTFTWGRSQNRARPQGGDRGFQAAEGRVAVVVVEGTGEKLEARRKPRLLPEADGAVGADDGEQGIAAQDLPVAVGIDDLDIDLRSVQAAADTQLLLRVAHERVGVYRADDLYAR